MNKINRILNGSAWKTIYHGVALLITAPLAIVGFIAPQNTTILFTIATSIATVMNFRYLVEARRLKL